MCRTLWTCRVVAHCSTRSAQQGLDLPWQPLQQCREAAPVGNVILPETVMNGSNTRTKLQSTTPSTTPSLSAPEGVPELGGVCGLVGQEPQFQ